jgi:PhnB protein
MQTLLTPYIHFKDNARQAMEFYQTVFGGELDIRTFKELGASQNPSEDDLVMHSMIEAANGLTLMASDTTPRMEYKSGSDFSISLSGDNEEEIKDYFEKLSAGGTVVQPLQKATWGDTFGMCVDKFGIKWLFNISGPQTDAPKKEEAAS